MKTKLIAFGISLVVLFSTAFATQQKNNESIAKYKPAYAYANNDARNSSYDAMKCALDDNSILVLGSSELTRPDSLAYPNHLFNYGKSDFNMVLVGRGATQSLHHAINVGAMHKIIPHKRVVLILSPQWFEKENISPKAYSSRYYEPMFTRFIKDPNISRKTKKAISNRVIKLLEPSPDLQQEAINHTNVFVNNTNNPADRLNTTIRDYYTNVKANHDVCKEFADIDCYYRDETVRAEDIDYNALLLEGERLGKKHVTNNTMSMEDNFFNKYFKDRYNDLKDSSKDRSFCTSDEYNDLKLFLSVCKETGIKPLLISQPVNGYWYDYIGFPKKDRQQYYKNIREIAKEYGAELADFTGKEYEKYFFNDDIHIGWKGWVYVDESIYKFYKEGREN